MIELYEMIFVKAQFTRICSQTQLVFASLTCNTEKVVFSVSGFSSRVFKIYMKPATFFCQAMNLVQSEPKLTIQISKASFVVIPATVELNRAVQSLLEHCPLSTPHRLFFGHNKRRRHLCYGGWLYRHRCSVYQLCRVRHNSCKLLRMKLLIVLFFTRKAINFSFSHENHRLLRRSLLILYPWKKSYPHRGTREGESGWNASREYLICSSILKRFYL